MCGMKEQVNAQKAAGNEGVWGTNVASRPEAVTLQCGKGTVRVAVSSR